MDLDDDIKIKKSKGQSKFDKVKSYNIEEDLMNTKANVTFAQLV